MQHTFHIPVMGLSYTIDSPAKVAPYGIDSAISLNDDTLMERLRAHFASVFNLDYTPLPDDTPDCRARRITAYLNQMNNIVRLKWKTLTSHISEEARKYLAMLPDTSETGKKYRQWLRQSDTPSALPDWLIKMLKPGSIDVNIMTKVDGAHYVKGEALPVEYNNAHAALRGFANSTLQSSVIFSAGMNPRLYSYAATFPDFFPDEKGYLKKKIILKVSDYRSALVQGKFLANKGLWVSEFRIESGLNCGGHAFATEGFLLGPVLDSFRNKRQELQDTLHAAYAEKLRELGYKAPATPFNTRITVQGGVGTAAEHNFLLEHYGVDGVGWGTPFLMVPEAVNVEKPTRDLLAKAKEDDLYLSDISPLGVPFNNLRNNTKDREKASLIAKNRPGSACPKKYLAFNTEFTQQPICTASREYQHKKLRALEKEGMEPDALAREQEKVKNKACLCTGLGTGALLVNGLSTKKEGAGTSICPGPNMAYFSRTVSLRTMTDHIYGRTNIIDRQDRPHMFIKELALYLDWFNNLMNTSPTPDNKAQKRYTSICSNLLDGIEYYKQLFAHRNILTSEDYKTLKSAENTLRLCPA